MLREIPESEAGHNDYSQWFFETQRSQWEKEQKEEQMSSNFGVVLFGSRQEDASPLYLYRYVSLKDTRDHLIKYGHLKYFA